jgi:periplasmic protein TonB
MTARAIVLLERDSHDVLRWLLAGAVVVTAYAGLVAGYLFFKPVPQGAREAAPIIIDMAPAPVAPASELDIAPGPEMMEAAPPPEPKVKEPPPPEPIVELPPPPPVTPLVSLPEPPPPEPPEVKEEPSPEKPPEPKKVEKKNKPAPRTTAAPRSKQKTAPRPAAPNAGASTAAATATWRDRVVSQLQRAKRYPSGAQSRREQGVVVLSFTLSRGGTVLGRGIVRSSGNSELDREVLSMVMRAQPFPPFPPGMNQGRISLSVPVRFSLR